MKNICLICLKEFVPSKYKRNQKFCSPRCRETGRKVYKARYNKKYIKLNKDYYRNYMSEYRSL